jgi:hypothetical protein
MPDQNGFDLGGVGASVVPADIACQAGSASIGSTTMTDGFDYHVFSCGSSLPVGVGASIVVGSTNKLINPSTGVGSTTEGDADIFSYYVRRVSTGGVDTKSGKIAVVESVRVRATVDSTLTFTIGTSGVTNVGDTRCGVPLSSSAANTSATSVNFGNLQLSTFGSLAHQLSCVTNSASGYVITVYENQPLTMSNGTGYTIPNTPCDSGTCGVGTTAQWMQSIDTNNGFGYSLQNITASTIAPVSTGTTFFATQFGVGAANASTIMTKTSALSQTEKAYVCYRIKVGALQPAGDYENNIVYTATATF